MLWNIQLSTTETTIKQAGVWEKIAVLTMLFCNTDTATRTITVYAYPSTWSANATSTIMSSFSIPAGDTFTWSTNEKFILENQDKISWICDVAWKVSVCVNSLTI